MPQAVRFLKPSGPYNAGEIAAFPVPQAKSLIETGVAEPYEASPVTVKRSTPTNTTEANTTEANTTEANTTEADAVRGELIAALSRTRTRIK